MFVKDGSGGSFRAGPLVSGIPFAKIASFSLPVPARAISVMVECCNALSTSCDTRLITGRLVSACGVFAEDVLVAVVVVEGVIAVVVEAVVVVVVDGEVAVFVVGVVAVAVEGDVAVVVTGTVAEVDASLVDGGWEAESVFVAVGSTLL